MAYGIGIFSRFFGIFWIIFGISFGFLGFLGFFWGIFGIYWIFSQKSVRDFFRVIFPSGGDDKLTYFLFNSPNLLKLSAVLDFFSLVHVEAENRYILKLDISTLFVMDHFPTSCRNFRKIDEMPVEILCQKAV